MTETREPYATFDTWAIVEIMGHQKFAGRVSEQIVAGSAFLRVDIPAVGDQPEFTKLFGTGSVYAISPCTEEIARGVAQTVGQVPISRYDLPESMRPKLMHRTTPVDLDPDEDDTEGPW